ncbi:cadherin domain-containing protein [Parasphingopyxis algicola]|uniref:PQQ-dependent sugar dehydrogenase n=1 Tax=Parasphingopyxis algicola TaxID=2026624 RepID=UPI0015A3B869|nr:PQQ-dependent sugar dehydrogenase [Parasphingopyxis algicola]QLC26627.1 cadherin domain-containing protein [Parasphingopyxis algicola]
MTRFLTSTACLISLAACGGGSGTPAPPPPPANNAPTITSAATAQVAENDQINYQAQANDADGDAVTLSISGGADASLFSMDAAGNLRFNSPPDFELPTDANRDNVYRVNIAANDGQASGTLNLSITVTNDREGIAVRRIATGFDEPTFAELIPGSSELFVTERGGRIFRLDPSSGQRTLYRTVTNISTAGEGGLLGIAADPGFSTNDTVHVFVVDQGGSINIRSLFGTGSDFETKMTIAHPNFTNHYGGWIDFGPDDYLYISTGDGGGSGDPDDNAQDPNSLLGKILRIEVVPCATCGASVQPIYRIPPDNPFASGGGRGEIYALGLRNPFRASFLDDDILVGDVGQDSFEEVNRFSTDDDGGINFGWPFREGSASFRGTPPDDLADPVTEYPNGDGPREGASVIGGVVYDGAIADLFGKYIFADFVSGNIWSVPIGSLDDDMILPSSEYERRNADFEPDAGSIDQIVALVRSDAGDVYIVDFDGDIFVVEPA